MLNDEISDLLFDAKKLAKRYKEVTGKPLGVTGEIAEFTAAKILGLQLTAARHPGYDATKEVDGKLIRYQIKGRSKLDHPKGRVGAIKKENEFDFVLLVLLDEDYEVLSIYEADQAQIKQALDAPGSTSRNIRRQMSVRKFISIGQEIWSRQP